MQLLTAMEERQPRIVADAVALNAELDSRSNKNVSLFTRELLGP